MAHDREDAQAEAVRTQEAPQYQGARLAFPQGQPEGPAQAPVDPWFPDREDAVAANQQSLLEHGQGNHALLRPDVLEGALGRAQNYWHYENDMPRAAAALMHGVGQSQAFEDGNKRTAFNLGRIFLDQNGLGQVSPLDQDDEELADHLIGYGEGTYGMEDTANLIRQRMGQRRAAVPYRVLPADRGESFYNYLGSRELDDDDDSRIFNAYYGSDLVGSAKWDKHGFLHHVYVVPQHRGQGLMRQLLRQYEPDEVDGDFTDPALRTKVEQIVSENRGQRMGQRQGSTEYPDEVWQRGMCGTYAYGLTQMNPNLRFGVAGTKFHDDDGGWWPDHFFAHDDTHAYDSLGKHPLPYHGVNNQYDVSELDQDPMDWGVPEEEAGPEGPEPSIAAAQEHARFNKIAAQYRDWEWGNWGKGWVDPDGMLNLWKTNFEGNPHHESIWLDTWGDTDPDGYTDPVHIAPDGTYTNSHAINMGAPDQNWRDPLEDVEKPRELRYMHPKDWIAKHWSGGGYGHADKLAREDGWDYEPQDTMYHFAPKGMEERIAKHGIQPTQSLDDRFNPLGNGVYLYGIDRESAHAIHMKDAGDLYQVDTRGLDLQPDYELEGAWYHPQAIEPHRVKRIVDQQRQGSSAQTMYHAAPKEYREQIERSGLLDTPYLTEEPEGAEAWRELFTTEYPERGAHDVWEAEVNPNALEQDPDGAEVDWIHNEPIPPERVRRVSNILDPIHDTLDPRVWVNPAAATPQLRPEHSDFIYETIFKALDGQGYDGMENWLSVVFTGSLTTYQYSDDSDVDMSLFVDTETFPDWSRGEMIGIMISECDGTTLPGTPFPLQCFVVPPNVSKEDLYQPGVRSGYDLSTDTWIVPPDRSRVHDVQKEMNGAYTVALENADKMEKLLRYEPDKAIMFWHQIHKRRMRDQNRGKGDYSPSNITYKMLANRGLFPQISEVSGEHIASAETKLDFSGLVS